MPVIEIAKIQVRRGQENQTGMPQLDSGEFGWAEDTEHLYIGKRIVDGAVDNNNTRILTENDLVNIFGLIAPGSAVASTSTYKYRDNLPQGYINSTVTSMATKLDDSANLTDWGLKPSTTATDIYSYLNTAVQDLFNNQYIPDAKRQLRIPAGNYYVSNVVYLPPNTNLVGEGKGLTTLILTNTSTNLFQTIDSQGHLYGNMPNSKVTQPKNIHIEGMSLKFNTGTTCTNTLLSLDNVYNAEVIDVGFGALTASAQTYETFVIDANASNGSGPNVFVVDTAVYPEFIGLNVASGVYYVTGNITYANKFAKITALTGTASSLYTFATTSTFGSMDFSVGGEGFSLLQYNGWGKGVEARGQYGGYTSDAAKLCANIQIRDCEFSNLNTCVESTGSTSRILIENNVIGHSIKGVDFYYDNNVSDANINIGPTNGIITRNRFESIVQEAIHVGVNPSNYPSSHISSYNYFNQCSNGLRITDNNVTTTTYSIINFESIGNRTDNDYFNRRMMANVALAGTPVNIYDPTFYYNPLAKGSTSIIDNSAITVPAPINTLTNIVSFPFNNQSQYIEFKYSMTSSVLNRKGIVTLNLTAAGGTSISDTYTYTEQQSSYDATTDNMAISAGGGLDRLVVASSYSLLGNLVGINGGTSNFYITGSTKYANKTALVISVTQVGGSFVIITQSNIPQFDYTTPGETWSLLEADRPLFTTNIITTSNAVTLVCDTRLCQQPVSIEYQTSLFF